MLDDFPLSPTAIRMYRGYAIDAALQLTTDKADSASVNGAANVLIEWAERVPDDGSIRDRYSAIQDAYAGRLAAQRPPDNNPWQLVSEAERYLITLQGGVPSGLEG